MFTHTKLNYFSLGITQKSLPTQKDKEAKVIVVYL